MVSTLKKMSFGHRFVLYSLLMSSALLVPLYFFIGSFIVHKTEHKLTSIRDQRTQQIGQFLDKYQRAIREVFNQAAVLQAIDALVEQTHRLDSASASTHFTQLVQSYKHILDYKNCVLFDAQGTVIFSDATQYTGLSLQNADFSKTELGVSLQQVLMTLTADIAEFSYDPYLKTPALFITTPLFKNNKLHVIVAIRINEQNLYDITDNYIGLGASGDLTISKRIPEGVLYLNKIRNELLTPFKKFLPLSYSSITKELSPAQRATFGYTGSGNVVDSLNIQSLASWSYVPRMNIGISSKISLQEVLKTFSWYKNGILLLLLTLIIVIFLLLIHYDAPLKTGMHIGFRWVQALFSHENRLRTLLHIVWLISCICISGGIYYGYVLKKHVIIAKKNEMQSQAEEAKKKIEHILYTAELVTQTLSYNIALGRLDEEKLITYIKKYISDNKMVAGISVAYAPYAYKENKKLFGRYVTHTDKGLETFNLDELYDYTQSTITDAHYKIFYLEGLKTKGITWLNPCIEMLSKKFVAACSNDFYYKTGKDLIGVVTVFVDMDFVTKRVEEVMFNSQGTPFLLSEEGVFIYHPNLNYKNNKETIIELAQKTASPELTTLWKEEKNLNGFYSFKNVALEEEKNAYFTPIAQTGWLLGMLFRSTLLQPPLSVMRHYYMHVLFLVFFFIISTLMLWFKVYRFQNRTFITRCFIVSLPLFVCFMMLLAISYHYQIFYGTNKNVINTSLEAQQFVTEKREIATIIKEQVPITIMTGIEVDSLQKTYEKGGIKISGLVWQYYDEITHKDITPGILFPQASQQVELTKQYETKIGTTTIIGWKFFLVLPYAWNERLYPLDINEISIAFEHPDLSKNIILIPDLNAYRNMNPVYLPGLVKNLTVSGFDIKESSFSFKNIQPKTTRGVEDFGQSTWYLALNFDIVVVRTIMNAILIYFLPIFIIMFAIYCFFILNENKQLDSKETLAAYTGLLLTIVFLHRSMREQMITSSVMYIEYFFILTYLTIFILSLHVFLQEAGFNKKKWYRNLASGYKTFFWDVQILVSIIITTFIFY